MNIVGRLCLGFLLAALVAIEGAAQQRDRSRYELKAAYLVGFGRFVEWKDARDRSGRAFDVCLLGSDPFGQLLDTAAAGAVVDGRPVHARRIDVPQDGRECDVLFVSSSEQANIADVLSAVNRAAVLTVSDMPQFANRGGMIQFVDRADRVRFEINLAPAQQAGLTLRTDLLRAASVVRNGQKVERR